MARKPLICPDSRKPLLFRATTYQGFSEGRMHPLRVIWTPKDRFGNSGRYFFFGM
jgi:hypothetical protein